ncbi:ParB/RepB/Spo0J family partition protein [Legionella londiniensis]|uniref:Probable chromosome-partitioning protein ParB n=1 Tax=Legionella londiniensis TaxID=45068 RepID=A0A0W0VQV8_9GAMM|nr:ParB/RepB/Spo0J family partition protein [Legionella londiniensis]KTD22544.1 partition protein ParB [Legionella londiniensis]STX92475.1 chromosome partitioning protein ParB [Legionella londiniensis]
MFKCLPIEYLQRGQYQPRESFDETALKELAASIRVHGLIEPLVVREIATQKYEIIAGERRWRAAMLAGLREVPCLIGQYTDKQAAAVTLIENIQRQDLNLLEEANAYQRLLTEFHFSQQEIAMMVGKSRSHIANILRLLHLSLPVQDLLKKRELSLGHARMLVGLSPKHQVEIAAELKKHDWSVRQLEAKIRTLKSSLSKGKESSKNPDLISLQTILAEQIGAPVEISLERGAGGWVKIKFYDNDTLSGLLERLGLRYD